MTAETVAERVQALRKRRKALGLRRLELYAHPDDHAAIREKAKQLQAKRLKASPKLSLKG